ncbi:MAG: acylaldehyde oxidase [Ramlibacter sp.]|nr:acylaldehyde oxidase [Ramlibacter sp.]
MNATAVVPPEIGGSVGADPGAACRDVAPPIAGVPVGSVQAHVALLGGGFGRRLEVDDAAHALRVAMDMPAPLQLLWSRELDTMHDLWRPMRAARLRALIGAEGLPVGLTSASPATRLPPAGCNAPRHGRTGRGAGQDGGGGTVRPALLLRPAAHRTRVHSPGRAGRVLRSVGHSHNALFLESFIDEAAVELGPTRCLSATACSTRVRHLAALGLAAARAGWGGPL